MTSTTLSLSSSPTGSVSVSLPLVGAVTNWARSLLEPLAQSPVTELPDPTVDLGDVEAAEAYSRLLRQVPPDEVGFALRELLRSPNPPVRKVRLTD